MAEDLYGYARRPDGTIDYSLVAAQPRQAINNAFAAEGMQPWYNDTTTALGGWQGDPMAGGSWAGPKQDDFRNPYYQQGGAGQDFVQQSEQAILPTVTAAGQNSTVPYFNPWDTPTTPQVGGMGGAGGALPPVGGAMGGSLPQAAPAGNFGSAGAYQGSNPYLAGMGDEIGRRTQQGLDQAFNSIRSNAVGTGGLGGSRQGVAEGIATRGAMDSLQGNLAGLFGGQYNQDANRDLTRYQADQQFYNGGRALDLQGVQIGGNLVTQGVNGGWLPINQASNIFNTTAGNNVSNTNTSQQGGGWMGAAGGALGGAQLAKNVGWFGGNGTGGSQTGWW
jgi:hypothetical protein